jgi:hypothetical protein
MVSHSISLRAVHEHSEPLAVTVRVRRSPSAETVSLGGTVNAHGAASWLMATCCSPIAMAPRRCEGSAFVVTLKATFACPCPEDWAPSCIHLSDDVAVHEHSRLVLMVRVPAPAPASNLAGSAVAVTGHRVVEGPVTFWEDEEQPHQEPHVRMTPTAVVSARIFRTLRARGKFSARTPALSYKKHSGSARNGSGKSGERCGEQNGRDDDQGSGQGCLS